MKTGTFLICLVSICTSTYGQNIGMIISADMVPGEIAYNEKPDLTPGAYSISTQKSKADALATPGYDQACYLQKSKSQKFSGMVLITGGSVIGILGIRPTLNISSGHFSSNTPFHNNKNDYTPGSGLILTGLVMMAGSIPYFIKSLKNKNKAGLKLACQKTSFGASNKACKKVTGLTFCIPMGK